MTSNCIEVPGVTLTRVGYIDVPVPAEAVGLSAAQVAAAAWARPLWSDGEQVHAGAAAWFADAGDTRLVFDPMLAADDALRADAATEQAQQAAIAEALADAGYDRNSVDLVVLSHIDGVGMAAWRTDDGAFGPFFPNARVLLSDVELATFQARDTQGDGDLEKQAFGALIEQGLVSTFANGEELAPGVRAEVGGGHGPGHATFTFGDPADPAEAAILLGHLAVSPLHLATGPCAGLHVDPEAAWARLTEIAGSGSRLIGPLWPAPGHGRWQDGALVTDS